MVCRFLFHLEICLFRFNNSVRIFIRHRRHWTEFSNYSGSSSVSEQFSLISYFIHGSLDLKTFDCCSYTFAVSVFYIQNYTTYSYLCARFKNHRISGRLRRVTVCLVFRAPMEKKKAHVRYRNDCIYRDRDIPSAMTTTD